MLLDKSKLKFKLNWKTLFIWPARTMELWLTISWVLIKSGIFGNFSLASRNFSQTQKWEFCWFWFKKRSNKINMYWKYDRRLPRDFIWTFPVIDLTKTFVPKTACSNWAVDQKPNTPFPRIYWLQPSLKKSYKLYQILVQILYQNCPTRPKKLYQIFTKRLKKLYQIWYYTKSWYRKSTNVVFHSKFCTNIWLKFGTYQV